MVRCNRHKCLGRWREWEVSGKWVVVVVVSRTRDLHIMLCISLQTQQALSTRCNPTDIHWSINCAQERCRDAQQWEQAIPCITIPTTNKKKPHCFPMHQRPYPEHPRSGKTKDMICTCEFTGALLIIMWCVGRGGSIWCRGTSHLMLHKKILPHTAHR